MIGLHLYTSNVLKRIYPPLNHLGFSVSDQTLHRQLTIAADIARKKLRTLTASGNAFITVIDNLNNISKVRDMHEMNEATQINNTAGYILCPPEERAYRSFNHTDIRVMEIDNLNTAHFVPSDNDFGYVKDAMRSLIEDMIYEHAIHANIKLPPRRFQMPVVSPIPHWSPLEIYTLPTYDLNEAEFEDMVEICASIQEQVEMSESQSKNGRFLFAGDLFIVNSLL